MNWTVACRPTQVQKRELEGGLLGRVRAPVGISGIANGLRDLSEIPIDHDHRLHVWLLAAACFVDGLQYVLAHQTSKKIGLSAQCVNPAPKANNSDFSAASAARIVRALQAVKPATA